MHVVMVGDNCVQTSKFAISMAPKQMAWSTIQCTHNSTSEKACLFPARNNRISANGPASLLKFIHACQYSANVLVIAPIAYESQVAVHMSVTY